MKVVLDTNIYLSGIIFPGTSPAKILDLARERKIEVYINKFIVQEIRHVLIIKFDYDENRAQKLIDEILKFTKLVKVTTHVKIIKNNPKDNKILDCALSCKADYLISGDKKHILLLKKINNTRIVSSAEFIKVINHKNIPFS